MTITLSPADEAELIAAAAHPFRPEVVARLAQRFGVSAKAERDGDAILVTLVPALGQEDSRPVFALMDAVRASGKIATRTRRGGLARLIYGFRLKLRGGA